MKSQDMFLLRKCRYNNKKGSVYLLALLTLTIVYIVMMVFLQKLSFELKSVKDSVYGLQAYYVATSGLEDTLYELRKGVPGNYFNAADFWVSDGVGGYDRPFPLSGDLNSAQYTGTYNINIVVPGTINDMTPSTFSVNIRSDLKADGFVYTRSLYVEGVWTYNKETIYITKVSEI